MRHYEIVFLVHPDQSEQVPGMSKLPVIGKMFKGESKTDTMNELLVFIAPRIL